MVSLFCLKCSVDIIDKVAVEATAKKNKANAVSVLSHEGRCQDCCFLLSSDLQDASCLQLILVIFAVFSFSLWQERHVVQLAWL